MTTLQGRVIKNYNGYYYVEANAGIFTCKIRGKLKQDHFSLVTGDYVNFTAQGAEGMIEEILPRKNFLQRPFIANVDLAVVVSACAHPSLSFLLLDKLLALVENAGIEAVLVFNKVDLAPSGLVETCKKIYSQIGYEVFPVSAFKQYGLEKLKNRLSGKVSVFAGPSGVGKSTLLNVIDPKLELTTGKVSDKIKRGRHTTRFAQLLPWAGGYIADTPGFSNIDFTELRLDDLAKCFREFTALASECRFTGCTHTHEPDCLVKAAVEKHIIASSRYASYLAIAGEIKNKKERIGKK